MKKISILLFLLIGGFICYPQTAFYYDKSGNKIFLYENSGKIVIGVRQNADLKNIKETINVFGSFDIDFDNFLIACDVYDNQFKQFDSVCLSLSDNILFKTPEFTTVHGKSIISPTEKVFIQTTDLLSIIQYLKGQQISYTEIEILRQESMEYVIHLPYGVSSIEVSNKIFENKLARYSQPAFVRKNVFQNPYYSYQWGLKNLGQYCDTYCVDIDAELAWTITRGDTNTIIALLDNGADHYHEDLENNILLGYNAVANCPDGQETADDIHGTMCAGIIVAEEITSG